LTISDKSYYERAKLFLHSVITATWSKRSDAVRLHRSIEASEVVIFFDHSLLSLILTICLRSISGRRSLIGSLEEEVLKQQR